MNFCEINKGNGWRVREILGKSAVDRKTFYFYKGKRALRIRLDSILAQQLAGYTLMERDLRSAITWLSLIDDMFPKKERLGGSGLSSDRERFDIIKGFYVASLVFYSKCFSKCEGRRAQLNRKNIDSGFREAHDFAIRQRNNFAAHSGADKFEDVKVAVVIPSAKASREPAQIFTELAQPDTWYSMNDEESFLGLVKHAHKVVKDRVDSLADKILADEVLPFGREYWYLKGKKAR